MEIIYADSLFLFNLLADYLLCLAAGRVCGLSLKRGRYLAAAAFGALCAVLQYLPRFGFLSGGACKLALAGLMGLIAYGGEDDLLRCTAVLLAVTASFGGAIAALGTTVPDFRVLIISFAVCYTGLTILSGFRARLRTRRTCDVTLSFLGKSVSFKALLDSGNILCDPISGAEVMAVSTKALAPIFAAHPELLQIRDGVEFIAAASLIPEYRGKFRLLPYSALGGGGMLPVFRPERLTVDGKRKTAVLAALAPDARGEGFEAVAGI